jgi:sporulation protein YlmC with PRC-barrel domain
MSKFFMCGVFGFLTLAASSLGLAQQKEDKPQATANEDKEQNREQRVVVQSVFRLSTIDGMPVRNSKGDDLGKIEDLVIELNSGDVRYAAVSFGGFASIGDKLFAVPWKKLAFKYGEEDSFFILDTTEQQLKRAPGFDQNKWPDVADPAWAKEVDAFYGTGTARSDKDADDAPQEPKPTKETAKPGELVYDAVYRGANITGMEVKNDRGEDLGSINELVIDIKAGKVRYAALSFGGVLGLGDKLFAVPWNVLKFEHRATDKHFVFNVNPQVLKEAEGFDENQWPNTGDPKWGRSVDEFYKRSTEREAGRPRRTK